MGTNEKTESALEGILAIFKNYRGSHAASILASSRPSDGPKKYSLGLAKAKRAKKKRKQVMRQRYVERRKSWRKRHQAA